MAGGAQAQPARRHDPGGGLPRPGVCRLAGGLLRGGNHLPDPRPGPFFYVQAAFNRDYTMIQGTTVFLSVLIVLFNLLSDILAAWMNPVAPARPVRTSR